MKFLCIQCDEQMKLLQTIPQEEGAGMAILFGCPECAYQFCMLTNAWETQAVSSLGVRIGPGQQGATTESRCPFSSMIPSADGTGDSAGTASPGWSDAALRRLQNIPEFIRPYARQGIERFAQSKGYQTINETVLDEARDEFGM